MQLEQGKDIKSISGPKRWQNLNRYLTKFFMISPKKIPSPQYLNFFKHLFCLMREHSKPSIRMAFLNAYKRTLGIVRRTLII